MGQPAHRHSGPIGMRASSGGRSYGTPGFSVRLPAVEEFVRQVSVVAAGLSGRSLSRAEQRLANAIFELSIDYTRVRIIETNILEYRTVSNIIRVEQGFTIAEPFMAQTLAHELTHVWQYQQSGTGYMSTAIQMQIGATITSGSRNLAYEYVPSINRSFFQFGPEQQGLIVENYFAMRRDQSALAAQTTFRSNHMDTQGRFQRLNRTQRMAEISSELPIHERYIGQLRGTRPRTEWQTMTNPSEFMTLPGLNGTRVPSAGNPLILRPIIRLEF